MTEVEKSPKSSKVESISRYCEDNFYFFALYHAYNILIIFWRDLVFVLLSNISDFTLFVSA